MKKQLWASLGIILASILVTILFILSKKEVQKIEPIHTIPLVETIHAEKQNKRLQFTAYGTVQAEKTLTIHSEVTGKIIEQSPNLVIGGILKEGDILLQIDPRNYVFIVEQEKASVEKARFELQQEKGRQIIAEREWKLLDPKISPGELGKELALRIAQVREKEAALKSAESRLEKAKLDLKRTTLYSPLNAIVLDESVEVGDVINPQTSIATLAGTDMFRVQASIPFSQLDWILPQISDPENEPKVKIIQDIGGKKWKWRGTILRLLGNLDPESRMARILIGIQDPLGLKNHSKGPLLIGSYVLVEIEGPLITDVIEIPRRALRDGNKLWIKSPQNKLEIQPVTVLTKDEENVYVSKGIEEGEEIIISNLATPISGMEVKSFD